MIEAELRGHEKTLGTPICYVYHFRQEFPCEANAWQANKEKFKSILEEGDACAWILCGYAVHIQHSFIQHARSVGSSVKYRTLNTHSIIPIYLGCISAHFQLEQAQLEVTRGCNQLWLSLKFQLQPGLDRRGSFESRVVMHQQYIRGKSFAIRDVRRLHYCRRRAPRTCYDSAFRTWNSGLSFARAPGTRDAFSDIAWVYSLICFRRCVSTFNSFRGSHGVSA
jgi:hypothetical protein